MLVSYIRSEGFKYVCTLVSCLQSEGFKYVCADFPNVLSHLENTGKHYFLIFSTSLHLSFSNE